MTNLFLAIIAQKLKALPPTPLKLLLFMTITYRLHCFIGNSLLKYIILKNLINNQYVCAITRTLFEILPLRVEYTLTHTGYTRRAFVVAMIEGGLRQVFKNCLFFLSVNIFWF